MSGGDAADVVLQDGVDVGGVACAKEVEVVEEVVEVVEIAT